MKSKLSIFIIMIIVIAMIPTNILADVDDTWIQFKAKSDVPLNKEWTITFSDKAIESKIKDISIYKENDTIPISVDYTGGEKVIVRTA